MKETFYENQAGFRKWLQAHHETATEILVGFYKVGSGKPSMTWPQSVDEALCFGWIDGVRRRIDDESYSIRFTPRKPTGIWSAVNINKAKGLIASGLMQPSGLRAFEKRVESRSKVYAYENDPVDLTPDFERLFREDAEAWEFFSSQAPSYQKTIRHWIMRAKQEQTRVGRLQKAISQSNQRKRL